MKYVWNFILIFEKSISGCKNRFWHPDISGGSFLLSLGLIAQNGLPKIESKFEGQQR